MNCADAATRIAAYADGETDRQQSRSIEKHLAACADCAAKHRELLALRDRLRAELPRYGAPASLRDRVRASVEAARISEPRRPARTTERWRWIGAGALGGCAATVLTWFVGTAVLDWRANEDLAVEAVGSHVRATLGNQLVQVASSDQHTVKPWLSARLDYSPPVPDPRADGIALLGGRIDYLDGRPVATLVYRVRTHTVDVYVRPQAGRSQMTPLRTLRGFNVARASGSGMDWLAVSDLSPDVLTSFVQRIAREQGASDAR